MPNRRILLVAMAAAYTAAAYADGMPAAQQNSLIQKYCAVCHTDKTPNGGLSLEHFDASHVDPGVAAMVAAKLRTGAMGAAGIKPPGKAIEEAWVIATEAEAEAAGAKEWIVNRTPNPITKAPLLTASIVQSVPSKAFPNEPDLYRLVISCSPDTHDAEVQVAWSPAVPPSGQVMSARVDGAVPVSYKIEGKEKMGNGSDGSSGPGNIILYTTHAKPGVPQLTMPLPSQKLTITDAFPGETVVFPYDRLAPPVRKELTACFEER